MDEDRAIAVSPRHTVMLATELFMLAERPPRHDFVVRTLVRREANGMPLMNAEMVIAGAETRRSHPAADTYPLHFRKTYFPGRMYGDPRIEFEHHVLASRLSPAIPPPIGHEPNVFRSCLIPGQPYARLTPFGGDPPESNIALAQKLPLPAAAGLWRLSEEAFAQLQALHAGGLAHGDAELHNLILCPAPLEAVWIDFEAAVRQDSVEPPAWLARCSADLDPLLREAVYLQCALGRQPGPLATLCTQRIDALFKSGDRFRQAIDSQGKA